MNVGHPQGHKMIPVDRADAQHIIKYFHHSRHNRYWYCNFEPDIVPAHLNTLLCHRPLKG